MSSTQLLGLAGASEPHPYVISSYDGGRVSAVLFDLKDLEVFSSRIGVSSFGRPVCSMWLRKKEVYREIAKF